MQQILYIAAGGSLGAVARYGMAAYVYRMSAGSFPWGTLVINLTGSFVIGVLAELFDNLIVPSMWRSFLTIGFLGAYTTFSTFTLETVNLIHDGEFRLAAGNILASNIAGILLVLFGMYCSKLILRAVA